VVTCWKNQWNIDTTNVDSLLHFYSQLKSMQYAKQSQPSVTQVEQEQYETFNFVLFAQQIVE
jgi:hypothetical protein